MNKIIALIGSLLMISCAASKHSREPAASESGFSRVNLAKEDGSVNSYLGESIYTRLTRTGHANCARQPSGCEEITKKRAVRLYLEAVPGEKDAYYSALVEYADLLRMFPKYVTGRIAPKINDVIGYLNNITDKISAHKLIPVKGHPEIWEILKPKVVDGNIEFESYSPSRSLVLGDGKAKTHVLSGAKILGLEGELFFRPSHRSMTRQLLIAKAVYEKIGLDSTWRDNFVKNDYFSAYLNKDVVLKLSDGVEGGNVAIFNKSLTDESVYTNSKSAFLRGSYSVTEPINRMFLFKKIPKTGVNSDELDGRIGLFIDVFDATKKLGQDVVELALINPDNEEDFLMYYEADPE